MMLIRLGSTATDFPVTNSLPSGGSRVSVALTAGACSGRLSEPRCRSSDISGVDMYWVNDTLNFHISESGVLTNNTVLSIGDYGLRVYVNDTYGNINDYEIRIRVLFVPEPTSTIGSTTTIETSTTTTTTATTTSSTIPVTYDPTTLLLIAGVGGGIVIILVIVIIAKKR